MCDPGRTYPKQPRPTWGRLYGMLAVAGTIVAVLEASPLAAAMTQALEGAIAALVVVALVGWLRANRAALDQEEWCACAASTLTVREVRPKQAFPRVPAASLPDAPPPAAACPGRLDAGHPSRATLPA